MNASHRPGRTPRSISGKFLDAGLLLAAFVALLLAILLWNRPSLVPLSLTGINLVLVLVLCGLAFAFAWALLRVPQWQANSLSSAVPEKDRFEAENEARRTLATIFAGLALIASLYSTAIGLKEQREEQLTGRFVTAVTNLGKSGDGDVPLRVGAIYALERVARTSPDDHRGVMELLTSFIRERATLAATTEPAQPSSLSDPPEDVRAAVAVLARRSVEYEDLSALQIRLPRTNLRDLDLRGAHLEYADLRGADLSGSDLGEAMLCGADLAGAILRETRLGGADLRLTVLTQMPPGLEIRTLRLDGAILYGPEWLKATARDLEDLDFAGTGVLVSRDFDASAVRRGAISLRSAAQVASWLNDIRRRFPGGRLAASCGADGSASWRAARELARAYGH